MLTMQVLKPVKRIQSFVAGRRLASSNTVNLKQLSEMPSMGLVDTINMFRSSLRKEMHVELEKQAQKYGPYVKLNMGKKQVVLCSSPTGVEAMFRNDEKYPRRMSLTPIHLIKDDLERELEMPFELGMVLADGDQWQRQRSSAQKSFLRPRQLALFTEQIDQIAEDTVSQLGSRLNDSCMFNGFDLQTVLSHWSFEGALFILTNRRLASLDGLDKSFVSSTVAVLDDNLHVLEKLMLVPPELAMKLNLKLWRNYKRNTIKTLSLFKSLVEMFSEKSDDEDTSSLIQQMYTDGLTKAEIVGCGLDILLASLDTTARTAGFIMYHLGKYPQLQQQICEELTDSNNTSTPLFSAFLKETMRLLPIAPLMTRVFSDELVLDDYVIPADTPIMLSIWNVGRNEQFFPDPLTFDITRWERNRTDQVVNPFAHTPFGFGKRSCVGRRLAEMELKLFTKHLLNRYRIELTNNEELEHKMRLVLINSKPIPVKLVTV